MRDMDALMTDTMEEAEQRIAKSVNGIMKEHCAGRLIYGLATDSFLQECRENGIHITTSLQPGIDCVLVAYDNQLNYEKIKDVCRLLTEG